MISLLIFSHYIYCLFLLFIVMILFFNTYIHDRYLNRYNHDAESGDDDSTPMFGSFNTASPRHSVVGIESLHDHRIQPVSCKICRCIWFLAELFCFCAYFFIPYFLYYLNSNGIEVSVI